MYICQICKKVPATIHLTDIHNNVKKEVHICESCAAEKGFNLQGAANLPQLLGLAAKKGAPSLPPVAKLRPKNAEKDLVCPHCGTTWSQFGERGRLGCPHDYASFDLKLRPLIANQLSYGGKTVERIHVGKHPGPRSANDEFAKSIRVLEKQLRQAVAEENYETAARVKADLERLRETRLHSE